MNQQKVSITQSNAFIILLAFLLGWCTYALKLVSIIKLLGELELSFYPMLMLIQGISLFISMKVLTKASQKKEKLFYFLSLSTGFFIVFFTSSQTVNHWALSQYGWVYSVIIFLLSTFVVLAIDITTRLLVTSKISMLKTPKASAFVTFSGELGVISGALVTLLMVNFAGGLPELLTPLMMTAPFTISMICLYLIAKPEQSQKVGVENEKIKEALDVHTQSLKKSVKSYLPLMIALLTIMLLTKHFQGFAVFIGLREWQQNTDQSIPTIFSILALIQNGLILLFILPSMMGKSKSTNWTSGFQSFFGFQALSMFFISLFPSVFSLLGTGVIRKITQRSFLNKSFNLLLASIPKSIRFDVKSTSQKYAHSISYLGLALFSYMAINEILPYQFVWIIAGLTSLGGIVVIIYLLRRLNGFHVENIREFNHCPFNIYEAITSCYALANKDAAPYYKELTTILERSETRSIFKKSIIYTLGEMRNEVSVIYLIELFKKTKREDVQLEILIALSKYDDVEIDNFFQQVIKQTMIEDTKRGELKLQYCQLISNKMPEQTLYLATKIIDDHSSDERVIGNAIDVIGEIAKRDNSRKIYRYLERFIDNNYSRRIRINVAKYLYHKPKYRTQIHNIIVELQNTDALEDKTGSAYLCGILGITEYLPFIQQLNAALMQKHSTVLLTLLRLGQEDAEINFLALLLNANVKDQQRFIKQLHRVEDTNQRYLVYYYLLKSFPDRVSDVLYMMRDSFKNFDHDRALIVSEAQRMNIPISEDLLYQL